MVIEVRNWLLLGRVEGLTRIGHDGTFWNNGNVLHLVEDGGYVGEHKC